MKCSLMLFLFSFSSLVLANQSIELAEIEDLFEIREIIQEPTSAELVTVRNISDFAIDLTNFMFLDEAAYNSLLRFKQSVDESIYDSKRVIKYNNALKFKVLGNTILPAGKLLYFDRDTLQRKIIGLNNDCETIYICDYNDFTSCLSKSVGVCVKE